MDLTVILVNWRNARQTLECAQSLRGWKRIRPKILIVDNEATPTSKASLIQAGVADSIITSDANLGYGGGNNLGIRAALSASNTERPLLLLNSDTVFSEATALCLLHALSSNPAISAVGPVLLEAGERGARCYAGGRDIARFALTRVEVRRDQLRDLPGYPYYEVDYVPGTVFLTRSSLFQDVGLLDERYFFSGEIADFCRRARDKGHRLYVDLRAEAVHEVDPEATPLRDTLYAYYSLRNRFLYVSKHRGRKKLRYLAYWTCIGSASAIIALLRGRWGHARAIFLALLHGISGRYGNQNATFL